MLATTFSALRDRRFAVFLAGQWISQTGTWMERNALAALVYQLSGHDESWLAILGFVPVVPVLLLSMPAGHWVDRVDVRRLVLSVQAGMMVLAVALAAAATAGVLRPWHVAVYAALASGLFAIDAPARQALVPRIVDRGQLTNALALTAAGFNTARLLGGFAFFVVISGTTWGEPGCFWVNAVSFLVPIAGLAMIRERPRDDAPHDHGDGLGAGLRFATRTPVVRGTLLLLMASGMLGFQVSHLVPVYAEKVWDIGKAGQGVLHAWFGVGALLGGLTLAARSRHVHRGRLIPRCVLGTSVFLAAFALSPTAQIGCVALAAAGFLLIQAHSASNSLIQSQVPDGLRGRVASLFTLSVLGSFPLGGLLGGLLAKAAGAPATTCVSAGLLAAAALAVRGTHRQLHDAP
jgi:MFS family permease